MLEGQRDILQIAAGGLPDPPGDALYWEEWALTITSAPCTIPCSPIYEHHLISGDPAQRTGAPISLDTLKTQA